MQLYIDDPMNAINLTDNQASSYFLRGFRNSSAITDNLVRMFSPNFNPRRAIALDYEQIRGGPTTNVHPRRTVEGLNAEDDDPTLNAIVLGSWPSKYCIAVCVACHSHGSVYHNMTDFTILPYFPGQTPTPHPNFDSFVVFRVHVTACHTKFSRSESKGRSAELTYT